MFKVNRKQLSEQLSLLQSVAEKKGTMPILSTVLFSFDGQNLTLTGTDIDTAITVVIPATGDSWEGCIPSRQLYELSRLLGGDEIDFVPDIERIKIKWGRSSHRLSVFPAAEFPLPSISITEFTIIDGTSLSKAIERAVRCISADAKEFWMQGVSLRSIDGQLTVTGTNSRHFASTAINSPLSADVILPTKAAVALIGFLDGEISVGVSENQVVFKRAASTFVARLLDAKFPDWRPLVPKGFQHQLVLNAGSTRQSFRAVSVTARETEMIALPFRLSISQTEMEIQTQETERGKSSEVVDVDCPTLNGNTLQRGVNGQHFITFLDEGRKTIMSFNDDMRLIQLTYEDEPNYRYLTMALRA